MESKKKVTNKTFKKQKESHRHRKQMDGYQRGERDKLGAWGLTYINTSIYKIDDQQGPTV